MGIKKILKIVIIFHMNSPFMLYTKSAPKAHPQSQEISSSEEIWILIHGTFAKQASRIMPCARWWKEKQPFYEMLKKKLDVRGISYTLTSFAWSGSLQHDKRVEAGSQLAQYIIEKTKSHQKVHIIAHSHGGNVALIAADFLEQSDTNHKISHLYTLGTPIGPSYSSSAKYITTIYNFFSYGDIVQPILNVFNRTFDTANHIYNIQLRIDNSCPTHLQLHEVCVAAAITEITKLIPTNHAYVLSLFSDKKPIVTLDTTREEDLAIDKQFTMQLIMALAESKKRGIKTAIQLSEDIKTKVKDWLIRLRDRGNIDTQSIDQTSH